MILRLINNILLGANVATSALFLLVGFSDRISPAEHPNVSVIGLTFPFFLCAVIGFLFLWLFFEKKKALLSIITLICGYLPVHTYVPFNLREEAPDSVLKLLSYNVHSFDYGGFPDNITHPSLAYLIKSNADILCLQEVSLDAHNKALLQEKYPYIEEYYVKRAGSHLALCSKYEIIKVDTIQYESFGNCSACFYVKYNDDTLRIINNHLETMGLSETDKSDFKSVVKGTLGDDASKREEGKNLLHKIASATAKRAKQVEIIAKLAEKDSMNTFVVGDFNDSPLSYTHYRLAKNHVDCFLEAGRGVGFSYTKNGMYVRIDNILCTNDWKPYKCYVDNSIDASDHYPIICYLKKG